MDTIIARKMQQYAKYFYLYYVFDSGKFKRFKSY